MAIFHTSFFVFPSSHLSASLFHEYICIHLLLLLPPLQIRVSCVRFGLHGDLAFSRRDVVVQVDTLYGREDPFRYDSTLLLLLPQDSKYGHAESNHDFGRVARVFQNAQSRD